MTNKLKTADGVEFQLGMTVVLPTGEGMEYRTIQTDPAIHRIESFVFDGLEYAVVGGVDVGFFYSTPAAFLNDHAAKLRREIAAKQAELAQAETRAIMGS